MPDSRRELPAPAEGRSMMQRFREATNGLEFDALDSDLRHPPLRPDASSLLRHFEAAGGGDPEPLRNPHHEARVGEAERLAATPSAVLIPVVAREDELTMLVTERHESISYAGHICFPGGRRDVADPTPLATALRETEEEIGLSPERVQVLGRLGDYVTHSGFRIAPFVGLVKPPLQLTPRAGEVEAIMEIPLAHVLRSDSYELRRWRDADRANYILRYGEFFVTGPTVSLMIGLYEALLESHAAA